MKLIEKLQKNTTIPDTGVITHSKVYKRQDMAPTSVPMLNVALSGDPYGGVSPGVLIIAGPSRHFKTLFSLICAKAYLDKYPDAVMLFYDTEFGSNPKYFESVGIDPARVVHTPVLNAEQFKHDVMNQMDHVEEGDHLIIVVDSIGNMASKKEVEDALEGKSVADMTRAKAFKSFFRMVTPHLTLKNIPFIAVNHTYSEIGMFPKEIVGGGTGVMYSASNVWVIGRQQDKEKGSKELDGYNFTINIEKSRFVRERSKINIGVTFDGGVNRYSGILDLAVELGFIVQSGAWFEVVDTKERYQGAKNIPDSVYKKLLQNEDFVDKIRAEYQLAFNNQLLQSDDE